jgi:FKBP-type peptidyl-prolyl cis-trans isomerase 2
MWRSEYEPGQRVRHPGQPDWGVGQVQSVVGERVTVNFEHAGKVLINIAAVPLTILDDEEDAS